MKQNYLLDSEKLVYQREQLSFKDKLRNALKYFCFGAGLALIFWVFTLLGIIESPKNYILYNTNTTLVEKVGNVNARFDSLSNLLSQVQHRDDNCYRVVSQIDPISSAERQAGFGGTDKYQHLKGFSNSELFIESAKKSDILISQLKIQAKSYDTIIQIAKHKNDSLLAIPGILPVSPLDYHRISDKFGKRVHPITGKVHKHTGLDFAARVGRPIYSAGNGTVVDVRKSRRGYGNRVTISHGYGFKTLYAHMHEIDVKEGDVVTRGQKIGTVGNSGTSTGPHLHYEVIYNNMRKNPEYYYIEDLTDEEYKEMIQLFTASN